jgi:hypothetical protein
MPGPEETQNPNKIAIGEDLYASRTRKTLRKIIFKNPKIFFESGYWRVDSGYIS